MPMYQGEGAGTPAPCAGQSSVSPSTVEGPRRAGTTSQHQPPLILLLPFFFSSFLPLLAILGPSKGNVAEPKFMPVKTFVVFNVVSRGHCLRCFIS